MQNRLFIFGEPIERSEAVQTFVRVRTNAMVGFRCDCGLSAYGVVPDGVEVKDDFLYLTGLLSEEDLAGIEGFFMEHEAEKHKVTPVVVGGKSA